MRLLKSVQSLMVLALLAMPAVYAAEEAKPAEAATPAAAAQPAEAAKPAEAAAPAAAGNLKPLPIVLPKPMFIGTPKNIKTPNLEVRKEGEKQVLLAPEGCVNLALNKPVSGSDEEPIIGELKLITDGNKEGADGNFVEFGPGTQYVQIDLGQESEVFGVVAWHYHAQARVYYDVVVRTADDKDFINNVQTFYNNDHDNTSGLGIGKDKDYIETNAGRIIDTKGAKSRFVRLYSNGNTTNELNHYIEVEVWGKPAAK